MMVATGARHGRHREEINERMVRGIVLCLPRESDLIYERTVGLRILWVLPQESRVSVDRKPEQDDDTQHNACES